MSSYDDEPSLLSASFSSLDALTRPSPTTCRLRQRRSIFAIRAPIKPLGGCRGSDLDNASFSANSLPRSSARNSCVVDSDEDCHAQLVLQRAHTIWAQQQEDLERDFEAREAYRQERRWAANEGRRTAAVDQRVQEWRVLLGVAGVCLALRRTLHRRQASFVLYALLMPLWRCWHARRQRQRRQRRAEAGLWGRLERPTPALLADRPFFRRWPPDAKERLVASLRPTQCDAGTAMLLEGDPGAEMYFVVTGRVEVIVRRRGPEKARTRSNGTVVATLTAGAHFGEFALVNDEPRMASVWCVERTVCWALRREAFLAELQRFAVDDPLRLEMDASIVERRVQGMAKLYPLTARQVLALPVFAGVPPDSLAPLLAAVQPHVVPAGRPVFAEGAAAGCVYFVACGRVQLWKKTAWWRAALDPAPEAAGVVDGRAWDSELGELIATLGRRDVFGEVGVVTLEPQPYTAQAETIVDLWLLPRQNFKDFMLSRPTQYLLVKQLVNVKRAAWIDPLPPRVLERCGPLCQALALWSEKVSRMLLAALVPLVACQGDVLVVEGLLFVTRGILVCQDTGNQVYVGDAYGAGRRAESSLKALSAAEAWLLPVEQFRPLGIKSLDSSPTSDDLPTGIGGPPRGNAAAAALPAPSKPRPAITTLRRSQSSQAMLRADLGAPAPVSMDLGSSPSPRTPLTTPIVSVPSPQAQRLSVSPLLLKRSHSSDAAAAVATSPNSGRRRGSRSPARGPTTPPLGMDSPSPRTSPSLPTDPTSPPKRGPSPTKAATAAAPSFCRQRTTEALRFAAGFIPPGFAARRSQRPASTTASPTRVDGGRLSLSPPKCLPGPPDPNPLSSPSTEQSPSRPPLPRSHSSQSGLQLPGSRGKVLARPAPAPNLASPSARGR
eukprot:EG_transcript_2324